MSTQISRAEAEAAILAAESGEKGFSATGQCQACFRQFTVKPTSRSSSYINVPGVARGKIGMVLHGFERPGYGFLQGMCWGAGHPPYELSCDVTREWKKSLELVVLPRQRAFLKRVRSGEHKTFKVALTIYTTKPGDKYGRPTDVEIPVVEGEPLPKEWPENQRPPNFAKLRSDLIKETEREIERTEAFAVFLAERIDRWVFSPEKLLPKQESVGQLTGSKWFSHPKVYELMKKMPSPNGVGSFLDWANSFPRTLMYVSMRGVHNQRYYKEVRDAFNKQPMAIQAGLAVPERAPEVDVSTLPPEERAKHEAKATKEKTWAGQETKAAAIVETLLADGDFTKYLQGFSAEMKVYDHGIAGLEKKAQPGAPSLHDHYLRKLERAKKDVVGHSERMYALKRLGTDLKDVARRSGFKIKLPKAS